MRPLGIQIGTEGRPGENLGRKMAFYKPQREASEHTNPTDTLILNI